MPVYRFVSTCALSLMLVLSGVDSQFSMLIFDRFLFRHA